MIQRFILLHIAMLLTLNLYGVNVKIYSTGTSSQKTLAGFLSSGNETLGEELVNEFATIYIEEAGIEGINWDVAFVQMCLETGFLRYGGLVESGQNNFCGLGSFDNLEGARFPTIREGVRAHVQHLKAYSSLDDLNQDLLDPRFHLVERGSALEIFQLAGRWAEDPKYGNKLLKLLQRIDVLESGDIVRRADAPMLFESVKDSGIDDFIVESNIAVGSSKTADPNIVVDSSKTVDPNKTLLAKKTPTVGVFIENSIFSDDGWLP